MSISKEQLDEIALTKKEYQLIVDRLGREPNPVELGMFGALWSEHCGYKHSRPLLKMFPSTSPRVLVPSGQENAGVVDIGNDLAIAFKIESHNHPSAVEPFQGAATGIGGIVRDILAMGARPIALLNSLRFGPLSEKRNRYLFNGVVGGISWYGNCIGIPNVGGEIQFSSSYNNNPLVNAMCVGLVEKKRVRRSTLGEAGNILLLVGADTGRDGIHGASGLASRTFEEEREMRPSVQVGNPFLKKLLIEACLEASDIESLVGIQDLGAAGLTSAIVESAYSGGNGILVDLARVHQREEDMDPYDILLSESQERMLLAVRNDGVQKIKAIFDRWEIPCVSIGTVTSDLTARIVKSAKNVAEIPVDILTEAPTYHIQGNPDPQIKELANVRMESLPLDQLSPSKALISLLASPNIASKESVYQQYDQQVQNNTVIAPGSDAAVLRIKGTDSAVALCTDGNGRYCYLNPHQGGAIAVSEACRNLACVGATPIAITNCLNFGNPEKSDTYYQMEETIKGMAEACRILEVPVVSGNVSLYNETRGKAIFPTPVVGALGLLDDVKLHTTQGFKEAGDVVVLLGVNRIQGNSTSLGGSEFLDISHGKVAGSPCINLYHERDVQQLCTRAIREGLVNSAHDCSDGGLAVALAECCIASGLGLRSEFHINGRWDAALFGEAQSRIIISMPERTVPGLEHLAEEMNVPIVKLGIVTDSRFIIHDLVDLPLQDISQPWELGVEQRFNS